VMNGKSVSYMALHTVYIGYINLIVIHVARSTSLPS